MSIAFRPSCSINVAARTSVVRVQKKRKKKKVEARNYCATLMIIRWESHVSGLIWVRYGTPIDLWWSGRSLIRTRSMVRSVADQSLIILWSDSGQTGTRLVKWQGRAAMCWRYPSDATSLSSRSLLQPKCLFVYLPRADAIRSPIGMVIGTLFRINDPTIAIA